MKDHTEIIRQYFKNSFNIQPCPSQPPFHKSFFFFFQRLYYCNFTIILLRLHFLQKQFYFLELLFTCFAGTLLVIFLWEIISLNTGYFLKQNISKLVLLSLTEYKKFLIYM